MSLVYSSDIPTLPLLYKLRKLPPPRPGATPPDTLTGPSSIPTASKDLNGRIGVLRGDITTLAVDAIVNAANRSLLGGGGVDGAIHRAAGPDLRKECHGLRGCETGDAKITDAYKLPCKKVIHAVGPIFDPLDAEECERRLSSCYTRSLELAAANNCSSIAFSSLSTGVYGYPSRNAAPVAIAAVRKFLEDRDDANVIEKVVFVTFLQKEVDVYNEFLPLYFPPTEQESPVRRVPSPRTESKDGQPSGNGTESEAEAVAIKLPSAPTSDPSA